MSRADRLAKELERLTGRRIVLPSAAVPDDNWLNARRRPKQDKAATFLRWLLLAEGPLPVRIVMQKAQEEGHCWPTVLRARKSLGVVSRRRQGCWWWSFWASEND